MSRQYPAAALGRQLDIEELVSLSDCRYYQTPCWHTGLHIHEQAVNVFQRAANHESPRPSCYVVVFDGDLRRIRCIAPDADPCPGQDWLSPALSLLDIAIVSGDAPKAAILHSIGVPRRGFIHPCELCDPNTGKANSQTTRAVMIAYQLHKPLFRGLCADDLFLGRAIAGGQNSVSALLISCGVSEAAKHTCGVLLFHLFPMPMAFRQNFQLALRMDMMDRLLHAVDLGLDIRSLVVDPCRVLLYACMHRRFHKCRNTMLCQYFRSVFHLLERGDPTARPMKWRDGQTLLEMTIRCGQLDATEYLIHAHCEATGLMAGDLTGPMFRETFATHLTGQSGERTINRNVRAAEAARLAYHLCRHRYQVVIVQLTRWWSRRGGKVCVDFSGVIDHIAAFALAVPALPEILNMPRPVGTRRAAKRAAYRRRRAGLPASTGQQIAKSSESWIDPSVQVNGSDERVGPEVIQEVVHDSQEVAATISEDVAAATSHALWESAVELRELACGAALQPSRLWLESEGLPWKLPSGALMFVSPSQHEDAVTALADEQLCPDHIIFAESLEYLICEVLEKHWIWIKDRNEIAMHDIGVRSDSGAEAGDRESDAERRRQAFLADYGSEWDHYSLIDRTFLCLAPVRSSRMVTASTTDARDPKANPRRVEASEP
ncbi:unnamed protein product [Symbiodinium sp. CCMP2592]|nr:unnamed protein product [Symbiodinium sp. CCMP2592]